jgi:hypothetical protein
VFNCSKVTGFMIMPTKPNALTFGSFKAAAYPVIRIRGNVGLSCVTRSPSSIPVIPGII